jgi:predicted nucleic acid-binding protein
LALATSERRNQLEDFVLRSIPRKFAGRILPVSEAIAGRWGSLTAHGKQIGRPLATADGLIAATGLEHQLTLVTRNVGDFIHLPNLQIFNPWEL